MGCSESKQPPKSDLGVAPPKRQKSNANKAVWSPGKDYPREMHNMRLHTPDKEMNGITLTDCLVDNATHTYVYFFFFPLSAVLFVLNNIFNNIIQNYRLYHPRNKHDRYQLPSCQLQN